MENRSICAPARPLQYARFPFTAQGFQRYSVRMKVLVFGGRDYADRARVWGALDAIRRKHPGLVVISGGARTRTDDGYVGADWFALEWARKYGVWCYLLGAAWDDGRSAGPGRNARMLREGQPNAAVEFPGGTGTANMRALLDQAGVPVLKVA